MNAAERRARPSPAAIALALVTPLLVRLSPNRLRRGLHLLAWTRGRRAAPRERVLPRVERSLELAARLRPQTCLSRGVTRYVLLRRAGFPVDLVFGLGPHENVFAGHCWLELEREPYLEAEDPRGVFPEVFRVSDAASAA
jgi:hypothetical protein